GRKRSREMEYMRSCRALGCGGARLPRHAPGSRASHQSSITSKTLPNGSRKQNAPRQSTKILHPAPLRRRFALAMLFTLNDGVGRWALADLFTQRGRTPGSNSSLSFFLFLGVKPRTCP